MSDEFYEVISQPQCEGGVLSMGYTYTAHPVACAAALKNIDILESENLLQNVAELGPYFQQRLQTLREIDIVGDTRGSHFMAGIELVSDKTLKEPFPATAGSAHKVFKQCLERGLIVRPVGDVVVLSPPLIIDKPQIDSIVSILAESIAAASVDLRNSGV